MNLKSKVLFTLSLIFLPFLLLAEPIVKKPFIYYFTETTPVNSVEKLDQKIREYLPEIEHKLNTKLEAYAHIYLAQTKSEFYQVTRGTVPRWAGGVATPGENKIVVKSPQFFGQGVPLETLTLHEITHLLVHQATDGNYIPRWLNEGLCVVLSGEARTGSLARLGRAAAAKRLMGLPRVDDVLRFSAHDADLACAESRSAAEYLVDRFEWQAVRDLLSYVKDGMEFDEAFYLSTGVGYETWQVEWIEYAEQRYLWVMFLDIDNMIWILIVLFGVVVMTFVFVRQRMQIRKMKDEEDEYGDQWEDWSEWDTNWKK